MKQSIKLMLAGIFLVIILSAANGQGQTLSAVQVLEKSDAVVNAPRDQELMMKLVLIDKNGNERERKVSMMQKGSEKRLVKFLSPADQKGIAFLDLPDDIMYLYLPAFRKVRRIASHVKNQKFAGTDFTYDDMGTLKYAEEYDAKFIDQKGEEYSLELTPKKGVKKDYSKLLMWIRKDNFYPVKIEYYDKAGNLWKIMERRQIVKVGKYWIAKESEIHDLKEDHKTVMTLTAPKFDSGLKDNLFTRRNLKR